MKREFQCSRCHNKFPRKELAKIDSKRVCIICLSKSRKIFREKIKREVLGIRTKAQQVKDWEEARKKTEELEQAHPKIKGAKEKIVTRQRHFYITNLERQILYKKYTSQGMDWASASLKVKETCRRIEDLIDSWKQKELEDKEISKKFKEKFTKLIMQ